MAAVLVLLFVPIIRYQPYCTFTRGDLYFEGPLREEYRAWILHGLEEQKFPYLLFGDDIYVKAIQILRDLDDRSLYHGQFDFLDNVQWRYVRNVVLGYRPDKTRGEPPALLRGLAARVGPNAEVDLDPFSDCEVMRAAMIRVEDLTPEQRRRVIPKSPLPFRCYARHVRDPDNFDPRCGDLTDSVVGRRYLP
ncbi:hypothetical protein [Azospirillum oleiclasticum]|uniref:hypothetical protein n=1 Tax=Azospirillum oleiclasticum TaxID=2735135 RepID=UPI0015D517EB|nr:hypothetical protein [Azospirillum oleiclasticum]